MIARAGGPVLHSLNCASPEIYARPQSYSQRVNLFHNYSKPDLFILYPYSLKLGNLFLNSKMEVKIGDFGLATKLEFDGDKKRTICGTPNYIAPEILEGKTGHSYEVDVWSLGVIIYTLLVGKPPFETSDVKTTYQRIRKNQFSFPEHLKLSRLSKSLISEILVLDPLQRLNLDQILDHEFFKIG